MIAMAHVHNVKLESTNLVVVKLLVLIVQVVSSKVPRVKVVVAHVQLVQHQVSVQALLDVLVVVLVDTKVLLVKLAVVHVQLVHILQRLKIKVVPLYLLVNINQLLVVDLLLHALLVDTVLLVVLQL